MNQSSFVCTQLNGIKYCYLSIIDPFLLVGLEQFEDMVGKFIAVWA